MKEMNIVQKIRHFSRHSKVLRKHIHILPRIIRGYYKTLILNENSLRTLELTITPHCNVNCKMCYATRLVDKRRKILTPTEYSHLWRQAKKLGAFSIILSGGEPTIRKDLFDVINAVEPQKTTIGLVSNSLNLNHDFLKRLKESGVDVLHLSLNSDNPDENDAERDFPGHYSRVLEVIQNGKALGFEICLSTVVSHGKLERMERVVAFAKEIGVGVVFSLACPTGNWEGAREHLLTQKEWAAVDQFMNETPFVRSDWTINYSLKKECPGGREKICISPYGDVMGCGMNFISFGNIREEPLESIWKRSCDWPPFKNRPKNCLIAVDKEYLEEYLLPVANNEILPVSIMEHPVHPMNIK